MIGDFKGDLRGSIDSIIKIKIRNNHGEPQHKAEFKLNDANSLIRELEIWKNKFGVGCFDIKGRHIETLVTQQKNEAKKQADDLREFREKTRHLREPDEVLQEKMKKEL